MSPQRLIGMLLFPRLTQLDLTGPFEVFARLPNTQVHLVARTLEPVTTDRGLAIVPTMTFGECPPLDVVMVPGGAGQQDLMEDKVVLAFLRRQAQGAQYVSSVCTGSLVLGAAGLLKGKRATCHWTVIDCLGYLGAIPTAARVVVDGNVVTGAGVVQASTSRCGSPPFWRARPWRARPNCRSNTIRSRHSGDRPQPRTPKPLRRCGRARRN
jgi:cyclohexyl-isocyanide hydratase